jgi:thiol-disulfide isomerase/thioredoxin
MTTKPVESNTDVDPKSSTQSCVVGLISNARELQRSGDKRNLEIVSTLEEAMSLVRATPFEIEFQTRVELALAFGDALVETDETEKARHILREESDFAETIFQIMQATGTTDQKRAAAGGRIQVRDRARQVSLLGELAPEIDIKEWINGEPTTLADLRGRVVLLEFWATWCKPCQAMFPKLKQLDEQYRDSGLDVIALTRHYFAGRDTASSQEDELELMRNIVRTHDFGFRVGVAEDVRIQDAYGATGMPTVALIDREGIVRYAHFGGGENSRFDALLTKCLNEVIRE